MWCAGGTGIRVSRIRMDWSCMICWMVENSISYLSSPSSSTVMEGSKVIGELRLQGIKSVLYLVEVLNSKSLAV